MAALEQCRVGVHSQALPDSPTRQEEIEYQSQQEAVRQLPAPLRSSNSQASLGDRHQFSAIDLIARRPLAAAIPAIPAASLWHLVLELED